MNTSNISDKKNNGNYEKFQDEIPEEEGKGEIEENKENDQNYEVRERSQENKENEGGDGSNGNGGYDGYGYYGYEGHNDEEQEEEERYQYGYGSGSEQSDDYDKYDEENSQDGLYQEEQNEQVAAPLEKAETSQADISLTKIKAVGQEKEINVVGIKTVSAKPVEIFKVDIEMMPIKKIDLDESKSQIKIFEPKPDIKEATASMGLISNLLASKKKLKSLFERHEEDTEANKLAKKREKVDKAMRQRKLVRYMAYLIYLMIIGGLIGIACKFLIIQNTLLYKVNANLSFTIDNCTLLISDKEDNHLRSPVYVKYRVPTQLLPDSPTTVSVNTTSEPQTLEILNGIDPRHCLVQLFIQPGTPLDSLEVNCPRCNITQDTSSPLEVVNALNIKGEVISANFKDIKVGSFSFDSITGYLQLNNIHSASDSNTITVSKEGDIIIQSTEDFQINAQSDTQAFCFSGPILNLKKSENCSISGQNPTDELKDDPSCHVIYDICSKAYCTPATKYEVVSKSGNVYANLISAVGVPVSINETNIVKGQIYDNGIDFSPEANETISSFDELVSDQSKGNPFVLLDIGNFNSRSSRSTRWVISSTPSYSLIRPWWIGTFGATVLNGYVERDDGFLLPGFCPFVPEYTTENLLDIQTLIESKITTLNTLVTFVNDESMPEPLTSPVPNSGIFPLIPKGNPYDKWYSVSRAENGKILLEDNNHTKRPEILAAVIVSLIIAVYIIYLGLSLTFVGIDMIYTKLSNFANHLSNYAKMEQLKAQQPIDEPKKAKKKPVEQIDVSKYSLMNILRNSPSPSAFVDYFTMIIYRQFSSSVMQFYHVLFKEADPESRDQELDPHKDFMKGTEAKVLYEKFCFMNHLNEEKLTDTANLLILRKYGFQIVSQEDQQIEVFTKMNVKNFDPFLVDTSQEDENLTSLDVYLQKNVDLTQFEEDQVEVSTFTKLYYEFCDYNRLSKVIISPSLMKEKYDVDVDVVPQTIIMRIPKTEDGVYVEDPNVSKINEEKTSLLKRWWSKNEPPKDKVYLIDASKVENHFKLVMGKVNEMNEAQIEEATSDLILYPGWQLWDIITVLFHLLVGAIITVPLVGIIILNESQYEQWSLKNHWEFIRFEDIFHDPAQLFFNLYNSFSWNIVLMILVTVLWIMNFFDLMLYYAVMQFPQDESFKRSEKQAKEDIIHKLSRQFEWILVLTSLALYFGFIGLILTWLLLGAFINPNAFLPFASAAITFVTFVVTKYKSFKDLASQGTKAVMAYVNQIFGEFINKVLDKITQNIESSAPVLAASKMKELTQTGALKNVGNTLVETGIVDPETLNEYAQKFEAFDPKKIEAGLLGDEKTLSKKQAEAKNATQNLKSKAIEKIKQECKKRGIPTNLANFAIAISTKDNEKIKVLLKQLIEDYHKILNLPLESSDIILELLFPQGLNKEEVASFIAGKSLKLAIEKSHFKDKKDLNPSILIKLSQICKHLEDEKFDEFAKDLKELLTQNELIGPNEKLKKLESLLPAIDILCALTKEKLDRRTARTACLGLLDAAAPELTDNDDRYTDPKNFMNFFSTILANEDMPTKFDGWSSIEDFLRFLHIFEPYEYDWQRGITIELINLVTCLLKYDVYDISRDTFKTIEGTFELKIPNTSTFLSFWLKLVHTVFNKPKIFYQRLERNLKTYGLNFDLKIFLEILSCYKLSDFDVHFPKISVEKNSYFMKIAETMKADPKELLGLLDICYEKRNSKYIDYFLTTILLRMSLKNNIIDLSKYLMDLVVSREEKVLLGALKALGLDYGEFLLLSKGIMRPIYISYERFKEVGVTNENLISERRTVENTDRFKYWLSELANNINMNLNEKDELGQLTALGKLKKPEEKNEFIKKAKLALFYLTNWDNFDFSNKNVESIILALDNQSNMLKKRLLDSSKGTTFTNVDFISLLFQMKFLKLENGQRFENYDKDKKIIVGKLAGYLGMDAIVLKKFIKIFGYNSQPAIVKYLFYFFPDDKEDSEAIKECIQFAFRQSEIINSQFLFLWEDVSKNVVYPGNKTNLFPPSIIMSITNDSPTADFLPTDLMTLIPLQIRVDADNQEILSDIYNFGLFLKGYLPKSLISNKLDIKNDIILGFFEILTEADINKRLAYTTKIFKERYHPIKVAIAFDGLLNNYDFKIQHHSAVVESDKLPQEETIKSYIAGLMDIYPEAFDLFDIIYERDASKFLERALPIIRRISNSSVVNIGLIESLFLLSVGEHFNPNNLSRRFAISSDIIEFFVSMIRISMRSSRKKELAALPSMVAVSKVLSKLKVKPKELISLTKLIFSIFESDEALEEIVTNLNVKTADMPGREVKALVSIDVFKGLVAINKSIEPNLDMAKNKKALSKLKEKVTPLFRFFGLDSRRDIAFVISSLAAGNFLVLHEYKQELGWMLPRHDSEAEKSILNLTMGICGVLNSYLQKPEDEKEVQEIAADSTAVTPTNSLSYAFYLLYQTLDIAPEWCQAFMLDPKAFSRIPSLIPDLKDEFMLGVVLNVMAFYNTVGDVLGLFEWTRYCKDFYEKNSKKRFDNNNQATRFLNQEDKINRFIGRRFQFDYSIIKEYANNYDLLQKQEWSKYFADIRIFNARINQSMLYLIFKEKPEAEQKDVFNKIKANMQNDPEEFLDKLSSIYRPELKFEPWDYYGKFALIGEMKRIAIESSYRLISEAISKKKMKFPNFILTDLSILGMISFLRHNQEILFERKTYCLHQILMNVERKLFLEKNFFKMSKFRIMKLAGVCLDIQVNNYVELHLPKSFFTQEYINDLEFATSEDGIKKAKLKQIETMVLSFKEDQKKQDQAVNPEDMKGISVGDLGKEVGDYDDYNAWIEDLLEIGGWPSINLFLQIDQIYLTEPNADFNLDDIFSHEHKYLKKKIRYRDHFVNPKEIIKIIYDVKGPQVFSNQRLAYKNPNFKPPQEEKKPEEQKEIDKVDKEVQEKTHLTKTEELTEDYETKNKLDELAKNLVDIKTGLPFKNLLSKSLIFEETLFDQNMQLIQAIVRGHPSKLLEGDHALGAGDPQKTVAKIYAALVGLQTYKKQEKKDRKLFNDYLGMLSGYIGSDTSILDELLHFFVTGKPELSKITARLDINQEVIDFLLMGTKPKSSKDDLEDPKAITKKVIGNTPEAKDFGTFEIIRDIYQFQGRGAWLQVMIRLLKQNPKRKADGDHGLAKLVKMINFSKLKKSIALDEDKQISKAIIVVGGTENYMTKIFKDIILNLDIYKDKYSSEKKTELLRDYQTLQPLLQLDFSQAFEKFVIGPDPMDPKNKQPKPDQSPTMFQVQNLPKTADYLETLLNSLGISTDDDQTIKEMKLLKIFISHQNNLTKYKGRSNYSETLSKLVEDMVSLEKVLPTLNEHKSVKEKICKFLLVTFGWDMEHFLKSFVSSDTLNEAYILYNLYACLNINKILALGGKFLNEAKLSFDIILRTVFENILSSSFAKSFNLNNRYEFEEYVRQTFQKQENKDLTAETLEKKIEYLYKNLQEFNEARQGKSYPYFVMQYINQNVETLKKDKEYSTFKDIVVSLCDGTIVAKLDQTFNRQQYQEPFKKIIQLATQVVDFYGNRKKEDLKSIHTAYEEFVSLVKAEHRMWKELSQTLPDIMDICLILQKDSKTITELKTEVVYKLHKFASKMNEPKYSFIYDLILIVIGVERWYLRENEDKEFKNLEAICSTWDRRIVLVDLIWKIFFDKLDYYLYNDFFSQADSLIRQVKINFLQDLKDPQKLQVTVQHIIHSLDWFGLCSEELMMALISLLKEDFKDFEKNMTRIAPSLEISKDEVPKLASYLAEAHGLLTSDIFHQKSSVLPSKAKKKININSEEWTLMMKKIKEGTATSKDLFNMVDEEGDKSGTINQSEFATLATRLGLKLSDHRIKEIFAKVKGNKKQGLVSQELNAQEFEKALEYLQEKNLNKALQLLGITPELLAAVLIKLIILLLLVFTFIFLGIKAFAVGGTFGSIINSLFPAAGGMVLGKEKDPEKDKLDGDNVKDAADKGFDITTSEDL